MRVPWTSCRVTSQYRGVRWHYCNNKWEARIFNGSRQVSLGYFENEVDAALAYDEKARGIRGCAAVVNFPDRAPPSDSAAPKPPLKRLVQTRSQDGGLFRSCLYTAWENCRAALSCRSLMSMRLGLEGVWAVQEQIASLILRGGVARGAGSDEWICSILLLSKFPRLFFVLLLRS